MCSLAGGVIREAPETAFYNKMVDKVYVLISGLNLDLIQLSYLDLLSFQQRLNKV